MLRNRRINHPTTADWISTPTPSDRMWSERFSEAFIDGAAYLISGRNSLSVVTP